MNATNGLTKQNCNVACLQNRRKPIVYVLPMKKKHYFSNICNLFKMKKVTEEYKPARQHVPYKQDDFIGFPRISDIIFPSPPKYS